MKAIVGIPSPITYPHPYFTLFQLSLVSLIAISLPVLMFSLFSVRSHFRLSHSQSVAVAVRACLPHLSSARGATSTKVPNCPSELPPPSSVCDPSSPHSTASECLLPAHLVHQPCSGGC